MDLFQYVGNFATYISLSFFPPFEVGAKIHLILVLGSLMHISYWCIDCAIRESSIRTNISMFYVLIDVTSFS